jgi:hypothetical protein
MDRAHDARPESGDGLLIVLTFLSVAVAAYCAWTTAGRFLLIESARKPPLFILLGILTLLPPGRIFSRCGNEVKAA